MDQRLLHRGASGAATYDSSPPRVPSHVWVELSQDKHTQAELHYADLADLMINAREWAAFADTSAYPRWVNVGSALSIALLVASVILAFIDSHTAVGIAAVAFAGIWIFGTAAERIDRE